MTIPKPQPLSRAELALAEVREVTRELNATIAEAREVMRLMDAKVTEVNSLAKGWRQTYEAQLEKQYRQGIETYSETLIGVMESHSKTVTGKLDKLISVVTNPMNTPWGQHSLEKMIMGEITISEAPPKMTSKTPPKGRRRR